MDDNPMTLVSLESVKDLVREHLEHGEFVHGGRYECADVILTELDRLAALKQPRITREQIRSIGITNRYAVEHFMRELQLLKVPTEDDEPPEASREARMKADGVTEEDIAETLPPKPEDAR